MPDSWWLKVKRAQKHMVDINRAALGYASRHPYEFTRIRLPDTERNVGYRVHITEQPDPMIAVMLGDFIHNLRSALDYIMIACVPKNRRKSASFPVRFEDIFAIDQSGKFVVNDTESRENFETAIKGLPPNARALVIALQPYHLGAESYRQVLGIISRLENADKHRQLITVGTGIHHLVAKFTILNTPIPITRTDFFSLEQDFAKDNTIVGFELPTNRTAPDGTIVRPSDVNMEFTGTAKIFIKITRVGGNEPPSDFPLGLTMLNAIGDVRRILRLMQPFVKH